MAALAAAALALAVGPFAAPAGAALPDGRVYELASQGPKLGGAVEKQNHLYAAFSPDGDHVLFPSSQGLEGSAYTTGVNGYAAARGATGWSFTPTLSPVPSDAVLAIADLFPLDWSTDFSHQVFTTATSFSSEDPRGGDVYVGDVTGSTWVSQPRVGSANATYAGMSADASHILFSVADKLDPREQDAGTGRSTGDGLYERVGGRTVPVGLTDGGALLNRCGAKIAGGVSAGGSGVNAVSDDGRVVFFATGTSTTVPGCSVATDEAGQLYARIDGARTVLVSPRRRSAPDATRAVPTFLAATADGSRVLFKSNERLTDAESMNSTGPYLYTFDLPTVDDPDGTLTDLTPHPVDADGAPAAGAVGAANVFGFSDDATRVYFGATGRLTPGASAGELLYVSDRGVLKLVSPVDPIESTWGGSAQPGSYRQSASPDGTKFTFVSSAALPGAESAGTTTRKVYLYDAVTGAAPICVSCPGDGSVPTGHAGLFGPGQELGGAAGRSYRLRAQSVTDDGRVFFQAKDALVPEDTNGVLDVYEYTPGVGNLLISTGHDSQDSLVLGATGDGSSVAFETTESLVAQDTDNGDRDVYVARVGGGFPVPREVSCVGDDCQGPVSGLSLPVVAGTAVFAGAGGFSSGVVSPTFSVPKVSAARRARWAATGRTSVVVRVSAPGEVRVSARARMGSRTLTVASASRHVKGAGSVSVALGLSAQARRYLARHGSLKVTVTVTYSGRNGAKRVSVSLKRPVKHKASKSRTRGGHR